MREFPDIASFLRHMASMPAHLEEAGTRGLTAAAIVVEREAKKEIAHYQDAVGDFPKWAPLSEATLQGFDHPQAGHIPGKIELGYAPPDNPLLREGFLRDSISHVVNGSEAAVGSDDEVAVFQELGTPNAVYPIPPRSFLGGAAVRKADAVVDKTAGAVVAALSGYPAKTAEVLADTELPN